MKLKIKTSSKLDKAMSKLIEQNQNAIDYCDLNVNDSMSREEILERGWLLRDQSSENDIYKFRLDDDIDNEEWYFIGTLNEILARLKVKI